jgi:hypothetical protein
VQDWFVEMIQRLTPSKEQSKEWLIYKMNSQIFACNWWDFVWLWFLYIDSTKHYNGTHQNSFVTVPRVQQSFFLCSTCMSRVWLLLCQILLVSNPCSQYYCSQNELNFRLLVRNPSF